MNVEPEKLTKELSQVSCNESPALYRFPPELQSDDHQELSQPLSGSAAARINVHAIRFLLRRPPGNQ